MNDHTSETASSMDVKPAPQIGRRERAKREKRSKIVEAARYLFSTKGFNATTTLEIAERADIGSGTLFLYAKTKEDLLVLVFHDEIMEVTRKAVAEVSEGELLDQLISIFSKMIDYHEQDIELHQIITRTLLVPSNPDRVGDIEEMLSFVDASFATLVEGKKAQKLVRASVDPLMAGKMFFSIYWFSLICWLAGMISREQLFAELSGKLQMAIDGLVVQPVRKRAKNA